MKFTPPHTHKRKSPDLSYFPEEEEKEIFSWEWYDPPENSPPVGFFQNTSLHGLRYLGQRNRHIFERIFWLVAFLAAVFCAIWLIWQMCAGYVNTPIITVYSSNERTLDQIPFPAVTICNVNNIKKSKMMELKRQAEEGLAGNLPERTLLQTFATLLDIFHICESSKPLTERIVDPIFLKEFSEIGEVMKSKQSDYVHLLDPIKTLRHTTQSCQEMILYCIWLDELKNCTELFQQIETDYGYCCTFNTIPLSLLLRYNDDPRDDPVRLKGWKDADINYDNVMFDDATKHRKYPLRQHHPGRSAGLSILLNPEMQEYYCTNTDSNGFVVALNVPLDFPRMRDNGIAIRTNSEAFISVRPKITISDETTKKFGQEKRGCYFNDEKTLTHYTRYTITNCMNECIAFKTMEECGCLRYYMPYGANEQEKSCTPPYYNCSEEVRANIAKSGVSGFACERCLPTCTEINYETEATTLEIRDEQIMNLFKQQSGYSDISNVSIVHVYFNVDSTFPRLRTEATTVISLISNAGGLLGLCMGFSMLSLLEIIYHATIRLCCTFYRDRSKERKRMKRDNDDETERTSKPGNLPHYFQTNFGSDFYKTNLKVKIAWLQGEGVLDVGSGVRR